MATVDFTERGWRSRELPRCERENCDDTAYVEINSEELCREHAVEVLTENPRLTAELLMEVVVRIHALEDWRSS